MPTLQAEQTLARFERAFLDERDTDRDGLIERHLPLVRSLAHRYAGRGEQIEDLVQIGAVGLIKAIDRFDPGHGVPFTSYAIPTILGEIRRHFRDYLWAVSVPRRLKDANMAISRFLGDLTAELGRSPTVSELAAAAGLDEEEIIEALEARRANAIASIAAPKEGEDAGTAPIESIGSSDDRFEVTEDRLALASGWGVLDERESLILERRFFEDRTQTQIALELGISQMHVSRLMRRALEKLRDEIE